MQHSKSLTPKTDKFFKHNNSVPSLESYYFMQLSDILDNNSKKLQTLQKKYNILATKVKKAYNEGYKLGYQMGLTEGWAIEQDKTYLKEVKK